MEVEPPRPRSQVQPGNEKQRLRLVVQERETEAPPRGARTQFKPEKEVKG
ncbi:hypothetical protein ACE1CI_24340 [Aerosakkonemataceae cyanobacterium BLCC-F50]|uniref:Uncharacterized protein n=1 Tax=Floridaenema flaviceps BLCC-F50 TaxID=3153642 RepID=A0ABV4XWD9_9CYAN